MNPGIDWHKLGFPALLVGAIIFALLSIGLNLWFPTSTSAYNVALTVVLIVACIVALFIARQERLAAQLIGWVVLAVVAGMVVVDNRTTGTLPMILYIPPVAAVAIRVLVSFRAAFMYCGGVAALLIPSGIAYGDLGRAVMIVGSVALYIAVDWIKNRQERDELTPALNEFADDLRELADEYVK